MQYFFILLFLRQAHVSHALSLQPEAKIFDAASEDQVFVIGGKALYRYRIDELWQGKIVSTFRGAENYGWGAWALIYNQDDKIYTNLSSVKEREAILYVHPDYAILIREDDKVRIEHHLLPEGLSLIDKAIITNKTSKPLRIWHYQLWNNYYQPVIKPDITEIFRPIPGFHLYRAFIKRSFLKEKVVPSVDGKSLRIERNFITKPSRALVNEVNYYPASSIIEFSRSDELFDLYGTLQNPGSDRFPGRDSLNILMGSNDKYGPTWVCLNRLELPPHASVSLSSTLKLDFGESKEPDLNMLASMKVTPSDELYPEEVPSGIADSLVWMRLRQEFVQNAYHLKALSSFDKMTDRVVTSQGAIYLEMGLHTAMRDFINALVGMRKAVPDLARSNLEYCMMLQDSKTSYFPYDWSGALKVNPHSGIRSDMAITLLWGLTEVMKAKPDWDWFFKHDIPFYPPGSNKAPIGAVGRSPFDHAKAAYHYFKHVVGLGAHGLPKVKHGDWSDAINTLAGKIGSPAHQWSSEHGESVMVAAMAVVVLKDFARLLEYSPYKLCGQDKNLLADLKSYAGKIRDSLRVIYEENCKKGYPFFPRAILRDCLDRPMPVLDKILETAGQVWALLDTWGDNTILTVTERQALIDLVLATNDTGVLSVRTVIAPEGAAADYFRLQSRPWSVIRGWFTAAMAANDRVTEAWQHLYKSSLDWHNLVFAQKDMQGLPKNPLISGFDGWSIDGKAWDLRPIPMNTSRWNNANHPAMLLWAADFLVEKDRQETGWEKIIGKSVVH